MDSELVFRFDPRQEVQIKPLVPAGGFISSLAKLTMRLASRCSLSLLKNVRHKLYTYGVSLDVINTEAYLVLPDLDYGFDDC